jgi:hypothetical protein
VKLFPLGTAETAQTALTLLNPPLAEAEAARMKAMNEKGGAAATQAANSELQVLPVQGNLGPECFRKARKDKIKPAMSAIDAVDGSSTGT